MTPARTGASLPYLRITATGTIAPLRAQVTTIGRGSFTGITLTGPGGAGKTRLAVEAARAELPAMPDGVWLVELAPVTDPADVTSTVLGTLGLREQVLVYPTRPRRQMHLLGCVQANNLTRARVDRKSTRLNSSHALLSRMPSSA